MARKQLAGLAVFLMASAFAPVAFAEPSAEALAQEDRIAELERTVAVLADELERTRSQMAVPEDKKLVSTFGFAPGASKVYSLARGLSIGGYGEGNYRKLIDDDGSDQDRADWLRLVLYTGYKFTDNIIFNAEIEFEHATTSSTESSGGGSVSVEFAALDFLIKEWANVRAGLQLVPMGFLNKVHEPPFFFGVNRPEVERRIIPTTWRENGVGIFGSFAEQFRYEMYVINGFNAEGFDSSGLRGGRQQGNRALAEHLAFVARFDWEPIYGTMIGASVYTGKSGQNQRVDVGGGAGFAGYRVSIPETPTTIWEVHAQYEAQGFHFRTLFTMAHLGDVGDLSWALSPVGAGGGIGELSAGEGVAGEMLGVYAEVAYNVWALMFPESEKELEPFFRFEYLDTQMDMPSGFSKDKTQVNQLYTLGFSFKPIPQVVVKADYRNRVAERGGLSDEFNLGVGYVF